MKKEEFTQEDINDVYSSFLVGIRACSYDEIRELREELKEDIEKCKKSIKKRNFFIGLLVSFVIISILSFIFGGSLFFSISNIVLTLLFYYKMMRAIHDVNLYKFSIYTSKTPLDLYDKYGMG